MIALIKHILDWIKSYRLDVIKAKAEADNMQFMLMRDMVKANTDVVKTWLDSFKVTDIPASTVIRDEDEFVEEQNRLHPGIRESVQNAIKAGVFPELKDILGEK